MARIRTIKPELFLHDGLFDLEEETSLPVRVAFMGMFCQCDREGRFEWNPRRLKIQVLPYDDVDFSRVLDALTTRGFIEKYREDGVDFGWIPGFSRHQVINNREKPSQLPEPNKNNALTRDSRVGDALPTPAQGKGKERKGKEGKGTARRSRAKFSPPTLDEVDAYAASRGRVDLAKMFFEYFETGNWIDGQGNSVRNWKQKFITWETKNQPKPNGTGQGETPEQRTARLAAIAEKHNQEAANVSQ